MSDGPSDARAEGQLYDAVMYAVHDLREAICTDPRERLPHDIVNKVNELIADLHWEFCLARYAAPVLRSFAVEVDEAERIWSAVSQLRRALHKLNVGHRGWTPVIDPEVGYQLVGTGYELVQIRGGK